MSAESTPLLEIPGHQDNNDILLKNAKIDTSIAQPSKTIANITISQSISEQDGYYLVQSKGYIKDEWKQALRDSGAVLYNYVPNNAFITKMNYSVKSHVEMLESVKWVGLYQPEYRISPALPSSIAIMGQETEQTNVNITVLLFDAMDNERVSGEIMGLGGEIVINSGDRIRVIIAATKIPDISQINGVTWIEKYVQPVIFNDVAANITKTYSARNSHGLTGAGQIVAVADTGLDTGVNDATIHADIRGRIVQIFDIVGDLQNDVRSGHGTHVTGSVLGNGSLSNGQFKGMAPESRLVFQAIGDTNDNLYFPGGGITALFQQAYDQGARIHSDSWGSDVAGIAGIYTIDSSYLDSFVWSHPNMLILMAAGNEGKDLISYGTIDLDSISSPATAKNSLSVGASENNRSSFTDNYSASLENGHIKFPAEPIKSDKMANNIEGLAAFSGRGPTDDGRIKPDVVAPGTFVISLRSSMAPPNGLWGDYDTYYRYSGGTSMSTPLVAGMAALVRQYYVQNESITPSAALLKATIINGAHNMSPGQYGTGATQEIQTRPDYAQGWGRVDIENSLFPVSPRTMQYYDNNSGLSINQSWNISYYVENSSEPLRITIVWSDYPAIPSASITLVNNLDLIVTSPNGTYYGNGAPDILNNVEEVELDSPSIGLYTIRINGTNIPSGPQPFALVISGALDISPPTASDEYPINNSYTNNNETAVAVNITDSGAGINRTLLTMSISGLPVTFTNSSISNGFKMQNVTATPYTDGTVNVSINATDNASNVLSYSWSFTVDSIPPIITNAQIVYPTGLTAAKNSTSITLNASISDTLAGVKNATVNASQINSSLGIVVLNSSSGFYTNSTVIVNISDGTYYLNITTYDNAGNKNDIVQIPVIVDNTPPVLNITLPQNITYNTTSISLNVTASETISTWLYSLNETANSSFVSSGTTSANTKVTVSTQGQNNITVYAKDSAGNWNSSTFTFSVDSILPVIMISYPGNNSYINIFDRTINGSITDNNSITANLSVGNQRVNWTTPGNFSWIANYSSGLNYINITVTDSYNNTNISTTIVNVLSTNETTHNITNGTSLNISANASTGVDLVLTADANNSANVNVSINASINASYFKASNIANDLDRYVEINVTGDRDNITRVQLTMFYNHSDLDKNGNGLITDVGDLNEDTLNLYWYWDNFTDSNVWFALTDNADLSSKIDKSNRSGPKVFGAVERNITANYVRVILNHFSLYSLSSSLITAPSNPTTPSGGGGGAMSLS